SVALSSPVIKMKDGKMKRDQMACFDLPFCVFMRWKLEKVAREKPNHRERMEDWVISLGVGL
ncbi:hypothetical protein EE079_29835, partial [Klebsiella pneumoniae]|nr:hypothetical protein [Klebsiella pneumoniae]